MATTEHILISGAAGRIGSQVAAGLLGAGQSIRVLVRDRARAAEALGDGMSRVEVVVGDLRDAETAKKALERVDRAFLVVGGPACVDPKIELNFVNAAVSAGVKKLVKISGGHPVTREETPSPVGSAHWRCEREIIASGLNYTLLRPSLFAQNVFGWVTEGHLLAHNIDGAVSYVDVRDVARVACCALLDPGHDRTLYEVTGGAPVTSRVVCDEIQRVCNNRLTILPRSSEWFLERMPKWYRPHASEVQRLTSSGEYAKVTDVVERVTGTPAISFRQFVSDNAQKLRVLAAIDRVR